MKDSSRLELENARRIPTADIRSQESSAGEDQSTEAWAEGKGNYRINIEIEIKSLSEKIKPGGDILSEKNESSP